MQLNGVTVGVPREIMPGERRVAVIPETVEKLIRAGARVLVESGAGEGAFYDDDSFRRSGAEIVVGAGEIYARADLVLKVKEPLFNPELAKHEAELIREGGTLVCFLHPANYENHETVKTLARRCVTSFTLDGIPRISRAQPMDTLTFMSTVGGYKAALIAAYHLARFVPLMPTPFGLIKPAQFLVVGTGVAGLQAVATAKRLGAQVKTLDIRAEANEQARSLGAETIPFAVPQELATGRGGYARRLPEEWHAREKEVLTPVLAQCDAVILTALIPGEVAPILVDEAAIDGMQKGTVIVDVAVDQGGNCSITRAGEEYSYRGVTISGFLNIPATLSIDATRLFAQGLWNFLDYLVESGPINPTSADEIVHYTLVTHGGDIFHQGTLLAMQAGKDKKMDNF